MRFYPFFFLFLFRFTDKNYLPIGTEGFQLGLEKSCEVKEVFSKRKKIPKTAIRYVNSFSRNQLLKILPSWARDWEWGAFVEALPLAVGSHALVRPGDNKSSIINCENTN